MKESLPSKINDYNYPLIRAIHTAVKGRARYKVSGLYFSEVLKRYIEYQLSQVENIIQVRANHLTGNVLVIFHPEIHPQAIAANLQQIVLGYQDSQITAIAKQTGQLDKLNIQLILAALAASTLASGAGIVFKYGLDESILLALQNLHTPLSDRLMQSITFLGEPLTFGLIASGLATHFWRNNRRHQATGLGMATIGAVGFNCLLKEIFARQRPALWDYIVHAVHYSFPSGHAMVSTAVYGYVGYVLAQEFPQWRQPILAATVTLILAIGFSRLYLGVHWPTDVLAGYAIGLLWLIVCILYGESTSSSK
ncbi:phosphatase PAP2 family protein [Nostoc sp. TCL26-01]|uniref:phosphatase PAP2 family protein n=1 Tax=Nostoc sp. TCL26-01 TaxID=2576904 RepID=UPI0015BBC15A|nr:phosphatase PAP2 family protein [Nostoc sp. TCL26-01]QLE58720.1 phosphatase PAP2 family protein [Nostoc sp. TCL26-01]